MSASARCTSVSSRPTRRSPPPLWTLAPEGAPPIVPFVFVVIACGAASGFHALMSSGSTAKQLATEGDARFVGYGAMIGESLLGLMAVLACTAGFVSREAWLERYVSWQAADSLGNNIAAFIGGTTHFLQTLGIPEAIGGTFVAVIVVSFALTSLDSATRLLRYNVSEIGDTLRVDALSNRYVASGIAVIAIWAFAFIQVDGEFAGLILWQLFGTTNQLLAGLALLAVTLYLLRRGKPLVYTAAPMVFMLLSTLTVMSANLTDFWSAGQWLLLAPAATIFTLAVWLVVEAALAVIRFRRNPVLDGLEVVFREK